MSTLWSCWRHRVGGMETDSLVLTGGACHMRCATYVDLDDWHAELVAGRQVGWIYYSKWSQMVSRLKLLSFRGYDGQLCPWDVVGSGLAKRACFCVCLRLMLILSVQRHYRLCYVLFFVCLVYSDVDSPVQ